MLNYTSDQVVKIEALAVRLPHDCNGNPRFFIGLYGLADILGVQPEDLQLLPLKKYTGRKYGLGFVFQSYNLAHTLYRLGELFAKFDLVRRTLDQAVRIKGFSIEKKTGGRWMPYSDAALNLFNGLKYSLNV